MSTFPEAADSDGRDLHPSEIVHDEEAIVPVDDDRTIESRLSGDDLQAHFHEQYRKQLKQRQCPGCGEDDLF